MVEGHEARYSIEHRPVDDFGTESDNSDHSSTIEYWSILSDIRSKYNWYNQLSIRLYGIFYTICERM
jgi:hypothetical protein